MSPASLVAAYAAATLLLIVLGWVEVRRIRRLCASKPGAVRSEPRAP